MEEGITPAKKRKKEPLSISVKLDSTKKQKQKLEEMLKKWSATDYILYEINGDVDSNGPMLFTVTNSATSHFTPERTSHRITKMLEACKITGYSIVNDYEPEKDSSDKKIKKNEDSIVVSSAPIDENNISEYIKSIKVILQQRNIDQAGFNEYLKDIVKNHLGYLQEGFAALLHASKLNEANFYLKLLKIAQNEGVLDETIYAYYVNMFIDHSDYPQFLDELNKKQELKAEKNKEIQESNASNEKEEVKEDKQVLQQDKENASVDSKLITNTHLVSIGNCFIKPLNDRSHAEKNEIRQLIKKFGVAKLRNAFLNKLTDIVDFEILANASDVQTDTKSANLFCNGITEQQIKGLNAALATSHGKEKMHDFINLMVYLYWADKTTLHALFNKIPKECIHFKELVSCVSAYKSLVSMEKVADKVSQRKMYGETQLAILKRSKSLENLHQIMEEDGFETDYKVRNAFKNQAPPQANPTDKDIQRYQSQRAGYFAQFEQVAKRFGKGNLVEMEMETMKIHGKEENVVALHVDFSTLNKLVEVKHYSDKSNLSGYKIDLKGFSNLGEILNYILPCAIHKKPIQFMLTNDQYNPTFCKELIVLSSLFPESMYLKMTIGAAQKMMEDKDLAPFIEIVKGKENKDGYCLIKVKPDKNNEMFQQCISEKAKTLRNQHVLPAANDLHLNNSSPLLLDVQNTLQDVLTRKSDIATARVQLQSNYLQALTNKLSPPPPSPGQVDVKPVYNNPFNNH